MLGPTNLFYCIAIPAGICKIAALSLWTFIQAAPLWQMESKSPHWRLWLFLKCAHWRVLFHKEEAKLWRSCSHIWVPVFRDITGGWFYNITRQGLSLRFLTWDIPNNHLLFKMLAFIPLSIWEPNQNISDWKGSLVLNFLLKINK